MYASLYAAHHFYAARHFMIALRIAAGAEIEAPIELLVEWPPWLPAPSA